MPKGPISPIPWLDVLETGIASLDEQHRALVEICNRLIALAESTDPQERTEAVAAARALTAACAEHFRDEEVIFAKTDFPRRARHEQQHRNIESRLADLVDRMAQDDGSNVAQREATRALRETLIDVLFRHDLDYKSHLQQSTGR